MTVRVIDSTSLQVTALRGDKMLRPDSISSVSLQTAFLVRSDAFSKSNTVSSCSLAMAGNNICGTETDKPSPLPPPASVVRRKRHWHE